MVKEWSETCTLQKGVYVWLPQSSLYHNNYNGSNGKVHFQLETVHIHASLRILSTSEAKARFGPDLSTTHILELYAKSHSCCILWGRLRSARHQLKILVNLVH